MDGTGITPIARLLDTLAANRIALAALLAAIAAVFWLAVRLFDPVKRERTALWVRCVLGSLLAHAALAVILSLWVVSEAVYHAVREEPEKMEVTLPADSLARERLAIQIRETVNPLPDLDVTNEIRPPETPATVDGPLAPPEVDLPPTSDAPLEALAPADFVVDPLPQTQPRDLPDLAPAEPARVDIAESAIALDAVEMETPQLADNVALAPEITPLKPPDPAPALPPPEIVSVPPPPDPPPAAPVDNSSAPPLAPLDDRLPAPADPDIPLISQIDLAAAAPPSPPEMSLAPAVMEQRDPTDSAAPPESLDDLPLPPADLAEPAVPPPLAESESPAPATDPLTLPPLSPQLANALPTAMPEPLDQLEAPDLPAASRPDTLPELETRPRKEDRFRLRDPKARQNVLEELGGSPETERAIELALQWFARHQAPEGHWPAERFGGGRGHDVAAVSLATLSFLGWGASHEQGGPFRDTVRRALEWLAAIEKRDGEEGAPQGDFRGEGGNMYDHGMAAIALAEALALTEDESLRAPAQRAIDFIVGAQSSPHGGWRYQPGEYGDTSVFGWQVMALASAKLAGLDVPDDTLRRADGWLDHVGGGKHAGEFGYQDRNPRPAMVAEGMFCRELLGMERDHPAMHESASYLARHVPDGKGEQDFYFWYYAALALNRHQGPTWEAWNAALQPILIESQVASGGDAGSWSPDVRWGPQSGRAVTTAFAALTLEVYYRYLP